MCGFFGIYHKKEIKKNLNKFNKAADLISQRGPDDSRYIEFNQLQVKFFRLSILDLSNNGMQPMISKITDISWFLMEKFIMLIF